MMAPSPHRRVVAFGDSHINAIQEALAARGERGTLLPIEARRLLKRKGVAAVHEHENPGWWRSQLARIRRTFGLDADAESGSNLIGDTSLEEFLAIAGRLKPEDVLVSVVGGNQHAVFSTIQHPVPFDFALPGESESRLSGTLIPFRTLYRFFVAGLRLGDGEIIAALRRSTKAQVVHLLAPPPKRKNAFIELYHDTHFADQGIIKHGVSSPQLRMKFWKLQNLAIEEICAELGVLVLPPPAAACDPDGFLARQYYAGDATHANVAYGELVLQQLEQELGMHNSHLQRAARA